MTLDPSKRDGLSPVDAKFLQIIEEYGWHVMTVAPRVGDDGALWAYSTGLYYSYGHPEIILFNLKVNLKADTLRACNKTLSWPASHPLKRSAPRLTSACRQSTNYPCLHDGAQAAITKYVIRR